MLSYRALCPYDKGTADCTCCCLHSCTPECQGRLLTCLQQMQQGRGLLASCPVKLWSCAGLLCAFTPCSHEVCVLYLMRVLTALQPPNLRQTQCYSVPNVQYTDSSHVCSAHWLVDCAQLSNLLLQSFRLQICCCDNSSCIATMPAGVMLSCIIGRGRAQAQ